MNELIKTLAMGGYATYIWPAYGLVGAVFFINLLQIKWQKRKTHKKLQQWFEQ